MGVRTFCDAEVGGQTRQTTFRLRRAAD